MPFRRSFVYSNRPRFFDDECIEVKLLKRKFDRVCRKMRSTDSEVRLQSHLYDNRVTLKVK